MSLKLGLSSILIVALLLVNVVSWYEKRQAEDHIETLQLQLAESDSLRQVSDHAYRRMKARVKELSKPDYVEERVESAVEIEVAFEAVSDTSEANEVKGDPGKHKVEFDRKLGRYRVWGYTETPPPVAVLNVKEDPLPISLYLTKRFSFAEVEDKGARIANLTAREAETSEEFRVFFGVGISKDSSFVLAGLRKARLAAFLFSDGTKVGVGAFKEFSL